LVERFEEEVIVTWIGTWWSAVQVPDVPPVTILLPQPLRAEVVRLRDDGQRADAVRLVREQTGLGLMPAFTAVQAAAERLPVEDG
jgi:hypothetical protein